MVGLVLQNLWAKKARSAGIAAAVGIAVMTVVTLMVVSSGLQATAAQILTVGHADFTVAQKGVSELLSSNLDQRQLEGVADTPGIKTVVPVLLEIERINAQNPVFIEIGIDPGNMAAFGVSIVAGAAYTPTASHEVMLGWRAAQNLGLHVGDIFHGNGTWNRVVGIFSTGISYGDSAAMFPLPALQAYNRVPGAYTLFFVKVEPGTAIPTAERRVTTAHPELTTVRTASQFGRVDTTLIYLQAATTGSTILAVLIGAVIVGNTMLLSLFERTREFGLLRAIGWSRARVVALVVGEGVVLAVIGSALGCTLAAIAASVLQLVPALTGLLHPNYTAEAFTRGLATGLGMAVLGALYPAIRAANLRPLRALTHE